jgi:hypothetical protein
MVCKHCGLQIVPTDIFKYTFPYVRYIHITGRLRCDATSPLLTKIATPFQYKDTFKLINEYYSESSDSNS